VRLDLPTGDQRMPEICHQFRAAMQSAPHLDIARDPASAANRAAGAVLGELPVPMLGGFQ
jgi:hypothetical protein